MHKLLLVVTCLALAATCYGQRRGGFRGGMGGRGFGGPSFSGRSFGGGGFAGRGFGNRGFIGGPVRGFTRGRGSFGFGRPFVGRFGGFRPYHRGGYGFGFGLGYSLGYGIGYDPWWYWPYSNWGFNDWYPYPYGYGYPYSGYVYYQTAPDRPPRVVNYDDPSDPPPDSAGLIEDGQWHRFGDGRQVAARTAPR